MSGQPTLENFLEFLDYVKEKGLMKGNTASSRRSSAEKVLVEVLDDQERLDVTKIDLEDVMRRFSNLHGKKYTPGSLYTYQVRLKGALEDFSKYLENPLAFRTVTMQRDRRSKPKDERMASSIGEKAPSAHLETASARQSNPTVSSTIMPIQLRPDLVVHIQGLPFDLTQAEARKLANVITALAMD